MALTHIMSIWRSTYRTKQSGAERGELSFGVVQSRITTAEYGIGGVSSGLSGEQRAAIRHISEPARRRKTGHAARAEIVRYYLADRAAMAARCLLWFLASNNHLRRCARFDS